MAVLHPTLSVQLADVFLTCSDTLSTVDQDHWQHWQIILWLNWHAVFGHVVEQSIVSRVKDGSRDPWQVGVNVSSAGRIFTTLV